MCIRGLQRECAERAGANGTREYTIEEIDERKSENGISLEKKNPKKKKNDITQNASTCSRISH